MRTKLWLTLGAVGALALGATAGTLAILSASAANANNQFTAGTLSLYSIRDQGDTIPGPMFYTTPAEGQTPGSQPGLKPTGPWAPGDSWVRVLLVKNTGSLDAWLTSVGADLVSGSEHLAKKLRYCVSEEPVGNLPLWNLPQVQCPAGNSDPAFVAVGNLWDLINTDNEFDHGKISLNVTLPPPGWKRFYFYVSLPLDADNSYQGETLKVNFYINAEQKKNNP